MIVADESYFTPSGGMTIVPGVPCDNETLFRAYYEALGGEGAPYFSAKPYVNPVTGLFDRSPGRHLHTTSWDCDLGIAFLCEIAPKVLVAHGKENFWIFDNTGQANLTFPLWRQPSQIFVLNALASEDSSRLQKFWFDASTNLNALHKPGKRRESEIMMHWLMIEACRREGVLVEFGKQWFETIDKNFGGFENVWREYFRIDNSTHPIVKLAEQRFKK